jgi:hypothetical protein
MPTMKRLDCHASYGGSQRRLRPPQKKSPKCDIHHITSHHITSHHNGGLNLALLETKGKLKLMKMRIKVRPTAWGTNPDTGEDTYDNLPEKNFEVDLGDMQVNHLDLYVALVPGDGEKFPSWDLDSFSFVPEEEK